MIDAHFEVLIPIAPIPKGRPRFSRNGHAYTPERTRVFEATLRHQVQKKYRGLPLEGPLSVELEFRFVRPKRCKDTHPITKPDTDNLAKAVFDSLEGVLWQNDKHVVSIRADKVFSDEECIYIAIHKLS